MGYAMLTLLLLRAAIASASLTRIEYSDELCLAAMHKFLPLQRDVFRDSRGYSPSSVLRGAVTVYAALRDHLPPRIDGIAPNIMDIGCGLGFYDILVLERYNFNASITLVDRTTKVNTPSAYSHDRVFEYHNDSSTFGFYSSLECAVDTLVRNGAKRENVHALSASRAALAALPHETFDMIFSMMSWGFHYPVSTYADIVSRLLKPGGRLVLDVRYASRHVKLDDTKKLMASLGTLLASRAPMAQVERLVKLRASTTSRSASGHRVICSLVVNVLERHQ